MKKTREHYERRRRSREAEMDPLLARSCPQAKIAYKSRKVALSAAAQVGRGTIGVPMYCYKCPHCRLWHLTKIPQ